MRFNSNVAMAACLMTALWGVGAEAFYFTMFFVIWMVRIVITVATRLLELEPDTILYFAPWVIYEERPLITDFWSETYTPTVIVLRGREVEIVFFCDEPDVMVSGGGGNLRH